MDKKKMDRLVAGGWKTGNAADFLGLSTEEAEFVELKLALSSRTFAPNMEYPSSS